MTGITTTDATNTNSTKPIDHFQFTEAKKLNDPARSLTNDLVQLSPAAPALALKNIGESVEQIAQTLGLDIKTVSADLGIVTTPTNTPAIVQG